MKYRKKPVVIEAVQYNEDKNYPSPKYEKIDGLCFDGAHNGYVVSTPHIHTLEGIHEVSDGDWIVTGVKGEKYPVKPDIFGLTYVPIDTESKQVLVTEVERLRNELYDSLPSGGIDAFDLIKILTNKLGVVRTMDLIKEAIEKKKEEKE